MISVMASKILTISDLEKAINNWKLDNTSDVNMYRSLTHLIDLLKRSSEHRDRDAPLHNPEIFRQAIVRGRPGFGEGYEIKLDKLIS